MFEFLSPPLACLKVYHLPVENSCFFKNVSKVDVSIQEIWIKSNGLLKVMDRQPDFSLSVEDASKIRPSHSKVRSGFYCFQVTCLIQERSKEQGRKGRKKEQIRFVNLMIMSIMNILNVRAMI